MRNAGPFIFPKSTYWREQQGIGDLIRLRFIDLEKSFDAIPREMAWQKLKVRKLLNDLIKLTPRSFENAIYVRKRKVQTKSLHQNRCNFHSI